MKFLRLLKDLRFLVFKKLRISIYFASCTPTKYLKIIELSNEKLKELELKFGNENIEYMYRFDSLNGNALQSEDDIIIYPAKHFITDKHTIKKAHDDIREELYKQINYFKKENKLLNVDFISFLITM